MDYVKNVSLPTFEDFYDACLLDEDDVYGDDDADVTDSDDGFDDDGEPKIPADINGVLTPMWAGCKKPALFREAVIRQVMAALIGKDKPNTLLVGHAGCGKTHIVEELAHRMKSGDRSVPKMLRGLRIYALNMSAMLSNTSLRGELEEKINVLIEFIGNRRFDAILFIDEVHMLFGHEAYKTIAEMLKPALSRGEIRVIAATTTQEVKKLESDPAFNRRLTRVIVDELTLDQTMEIVKQAIPIMQEHYGIKIRKDEGIPKLIVEAADEMVSVGSHRPDNALTLLDRTLADLVVATGGANICLTREAIEETAYRMTSGNSTMNRLNEKSLRRRLSGIRGQDDTLQKIVKVLRLYDMHIHPRTKPLTLLFAGPSGVGKSEVARIISSEYMREKPIVLNMAEYNSSASINRIIGAPAGYSYREGNAELPFDVLDTNPYRLILLDEFEKSERSVQRLFLSAFDDGVIRTNAGKEIDFSKAIIIATTNAGCTQSSGRIGFVSSQRDEEQSVGDLAEYFDTELLGRFSHIFTFAPIDRKTYADIVRDAYIRLVAQLEMTGLTPGLRRKIERPNKKVIDMLVEQSYRLGLGARPAQTAVTEYIDNLLLEAADTVSVTEKGESV